MTKFINTIGVVLLVIVISVLCLWRATTNLSTYWFPMDFIGIIGFGFTLITAWYVFFMKQDVKQLSNKYSLKLALPPALKRLEKIRKDMNNFFYDKIDLTKTNTALLKIVATCLSLCEHLDKLTESQSVGFTTTKEITFLCREINFGKHFSEQVLQKLFTDLTQLINDVDIMIQNLNNEVKL
jgi:hypothetical protein